MLLLVYRNDSDPEMYMGPNFLTQPDPNRRQFCSSVPIISVLYAS